MSRLSNLYATLEANGINMPKDISVFEKNMGDSAYRRKLYKGLQEKGLRLKQSEDEFDAIWSKEFGESKPKSKPTTDEDLAKTFVMSPEWQEDYARGKEVENEIKAEDAKRKQTADAYNAYAKLEDSFAKYEQSQDVSDLFNVGQQEPIFGEDPKKSWRNKAAERKKGEAQAKARVDQEREEMRQRMQLLKDNPDAWEKSLEQPLQTNAPEVGLRSMKSFVNGKPVDKRGNVHDNWVSQAQANQRIDAEDKALQSGYQQQELQDMLADPMALDKEMSKLKAELAELTKQRDAYGSQFAKEHPWQMMANLMGRDSFDNPYEVGMYGVDAMVTQKQMNNVIARINMLTEAKNAFERGSWSGHGFWNNVKNIGKGMQQFATEINSYTDKYNIESGMALNNLANKIERGEMLTDEEMSWFVTAKLKEEGEKAASQGPTTGAVGYGTPASLEYMVTMAINPARGASKTISDKIIKAGVRRFGKSAFTKMMAKATGMLTEGAVLSTTLGADNVASDALGRMAGKVGFDDGGNVAVADRVNPLKAMYQSTMASTIESAVEMMGVPIIGKATKGIGKVATKLADAMSYGKVSKLLSAMDKSQIVNWTKGMQKATGWHNLGEEWGEENVTMLANAIIVGDNEIADMFDTRTQLEILGTCALISGVMSTANVAGFAGEFRKVNREYKKAKQEVLRQFSSDVWASLDNLITNAQDEDLTVRLADAMDGMAMNREQRTAIMNYLTALKRYQKFNELNDGGKFIIGGPQAQATQSTSTSTYEIDSDITLKDEIGNPIDAHIVGRDANGNYMVESSQPINGKRVQPMSADQLDAMVIPNTPDGIQQSEVDGYNLTDANQQAEVSMLTDNARESVATLLGVTPDAVDATLQQVLGDNPTDAKIDARFGGNAQVVKDYMYNVAKTKGMSARLIDDIADATAESDRAIDAVDNNGNVVTAKDAEGNDVNVVSGNIVTYEDNQIDVANSDASVVIRHADGTTEMVVPTSLTEVVSMPTEQAKTEQAQAIAQQMQQAFSDKLNGALDYSQGQQYTMLNADGSTTDVTILADNGDGNVTVTARDGNKEGGVTDGKQIVLPKSQIQQGVREFKRNQLRQAKAQQVKQTKQPQQVTDTSEATPKQTPSTTNNITPRDEQGNVLYGQMSADNAWDMLVEESGGDTDIATMVAQSNIEDAQKALDKAKKQTPKLVGTTEEKLATAKAFKESVVKAQNDLAKWQEIADVPKRRASLQTEQTDLQTDLQTESQGQQVADKLPTSEEVTTETPTESESTPQVGLVEDARTRTLGDKTRKMLDAMAKRLGLQVEFVDEIVTGKDEKGRNLYANAVIVGKNVKIAWHNRNRAIDFLLGHEFTHRMQDLSPEAYAEFVEAAKQVLGEEEWNKRIKRMRDIYKSQGKTISEQGIIDEVVADYAGELVEERGVFDNFVERNKNNRGLLSKIADVLRSIKEFFTLGKQRKINNAIARLEALIESASEANLRGDVVNMEKDRYSVSSIFEGTGAIVFNEEGGANIDKDGNFYVIINGKQYDGNNLITLDDIKADKRSVLNMMVEDAIKEGNVTEEHADVIMKKYVDIMNMFLVEGLAENGGYANMADKWMWVGETVYKTVQPNSDKQYTKSIDITTVCKKNEAVIRAMSEMQKRVGYGITPAQILDIYIETQESGYQVPCPVCYVFSRYLRNGKYASGAILGMEQYGEHLPGGSGETWTADQWVAELRRLKDIDEDKTNKALYNQASADIVEAETMIDNLGLRLQQSNNEAERKELREQIEKADARYRAALNIFSQSALTSWIKTFAIQGSDDKGYKMRDDAQYPEDIELFKEHALDLRKAGETQTLFPAIQRLRNSGGSSTGKAVGFESNNALGDVISGIATGNNDTAYARASKATTEKEFKTNRKKATENFKKASKYIKQQTLRGGQRMWSWSDNIEALMPDVVINLMQLELLGGALQTYSKQLEGVNLVARMGGYVNGSLMAKDNGYTEVTEDMIKVEDGKEVLAEDIAETIQEPIVGRGIVDRTRVLAQAGSPVIEVDGKKYVLIFDDVIGIDPHGREVDGVHMKGLFDLNKELSKAGNIIVGMNDTHIRVGLADSRIFFIIPWHASGANDHILTQMFRVLGADISSMVSTDYTDMQSEKDYLEKKKDGSMPKIEQSVRDVWNAHKNETDWKCGVKGGIDSSKETISDSQKHYRELRQAIFDGELINNKAWLREVQADEFLSQVYDRVQSGTIDNSMTKEDNNHIYPYEYWDTSKTYDEADINGERYIEYCRRLGFSPKFSGIHGNKEYKNIGNFTNDKGYWKLLVDRRMYDIHDKFQDLDPVTSEDYTNELVHPGNTNKEFVISEVADAKATNKIVDRVIEKEVARTGTMPTVDYGMSHEDVYKNYKPEYDVLKADEAQAKAETKLAEAKQKLNTLVDNGATKGRITTATKNVAKAEEALQQAKKAATSAEKEAQKSRFSLTNLTEEEQSIVDEAKANGTYLKTPNGKVSNLNERQWIQVRTKAFKDWFGDWENAPENASKVVDENGEPKVVYHQTNKTIYRNVENGKLWDDLDWREKQEWEERDDWDEYWVEEDFYEFSRTNARTTNEFDGFFFAPKYDEYHEYGDRTIEAFLNIRKPASQADYNIDARYNDAGKKERIRLQEEGYDGVIRMEGDEVDEYIAFEPTQIKSATDNVGTFDASNPDIRYSLATDLNAEVSEGEGQQMRYSLRTKPEPKKTIKVYKLFNVDENGNPQALFIDAANSLEVGVWYDADSPTIKDLEGLETEWSYLLDNDGNVVDKKPLKRGKGGNFVGLPSKADVNKATQEGQRWMTVSTSKSGEKAYHTVGINGAGGVSTYALRPGWHATNVPSARHIGVGKDGANAKYRGANQRWFEIEISADVDYNEEARERYLKAHPTYSRVKAYSDLKGDIPERIPEDGYYNFKTNSNANPNQDWYIAGAIKIVRPLTEEEGRKISRSKGIAEDLPYKDGVKNFDEDDKKTSISERSGAVSGNSSSDGLLEKSNEHLSRYPLTTNQDTAKLQQNSQVAIASAQKVINKGGFDKAINSPNDAVRELGKALKLEKSKSSMSYYGDFYEGIFYADGKTLKLRVSTHPANGARIGNDNADDKISIVIHKDGEHVSTGEHNGYTEYVYEPSEISPNDAAMSILKSVKTLLEEGEFIDESNKAHGQNYPYIDNDGKVQYSLQGGRSIADKYEKKVNTKGVGGAMHLSKFNAQEAFQDEQLSLKEVQRIIEQEYGIVLESYEDAYKAENALSSVNQAEWERYIKDYYEPMMQIIDKWILKGGETEQSVNHYLIAKSGLERNREFTVRDALAEMNKMDAQIINGEYSGTVLRLANALRQGQISQDEYNAQVQDAKDKKNQALENIKNAQQARVDAYRAERDALREQLKNGDISYEEFNKLSDEVALKHAKAEEIADYSGLTALAKQYNEKDWRNFAEQMVVNFENKHDNTDVLWERINNATKKAVEKSYESGITSKEAKNHLDQMFLWYVPMGGMENDTAEDIYSYLNRNADSAFTQTVKRAEGHSEHISDDVMAMIANTMQSAILQGNRNKMKQKFLNMVENYPTDLFTLDRGWVVMQGNEWVESHPEIKADYTAEQVRDAINAHNEEMRNLEEKGLAMSKEGALKLGIPLKNKRNEQEHAISVMRNGQKVTIYVNGNPRVAQALNGKLKDVEQTWIGKAYGKLKRYFSASKTSWNPDFVSSNFSRDIGYSTGVTFVKHGIGEWGRSVVMYAPAIATLVAKALGKKSPWGAKYDQYFDEFVRNGGVTGYSHLYSVDDWKIENTKRIDRLRGAAKAIKAHNNMWVNIAKVYNQINSIIENSSRFNEYARSRNRGEDVATSVWNAKEITLNFNKKGSSKTEGLFGGLAFLGRNLVPFFNPIMQGIYQFLKIGKEHKRRMAALCFGYMGMGFMQPFVNAMLVELLGGGDEDDYMKQPEYTRRTNFMLYTGDGYIKIPLAQIFREFYGIGDVVYCAMYGKLSEEDATSQAISQVRKIFSLDGVSTYFDWVADIATNTNFMGNPLWKENEYNKYKPEYTKAYDNTWSFLVSASKWLNEALGGDEHTAPEDFNGKWINPAIWQRVLSELGGGALTSVLDVYDTASALVHGEDVDWANVPIAKRLYTETDEETLQKWIDKEYFSNLDNYKMVRDRMSSLKSSNALDVAEKIDFMYHDPKYLEYVIFDDAQKEIKELRDKADSATDDNRAEREKALYDAEMEVVEAIDAVRAMEDNEVQTYMMEHPEVAYYINKDIEQKVKGNVKELQKAIARKEPDARKALSAYRKTPEYKYYNQIRRILKRIRKLESRLKDETKNIAPSQRVKMKQKIDGHKKELVELRKAYESIGEVKE